MNVAVLDDYQSAARGCADWDRLDADVFFFDRPLSDPSEQLRGFDVIVAMRERTPFDASLLESLPDLRLLVTTGMRNASIDLDAARDLGITVCGTSSPGHATAELTLALLLSLARGLPSELESVKAGGWQVGLGRDLSGATLGLIGLGRLGARVAHYGESLGMRVIAWSQNLDVQHAAELGVEPVTHHELFENSDFISIHLRLSERTRGLIGSPELELMKPSAYLINTSRGQIVAEDALLAAVREQKIAGAAIDVFENEPLPADHPFRSEPRILATPHIGFVTLETYQIFYSEAVEDIEAWAAGKPVRQL